MPITSRPRRFHLSLILPSLERGWFWLILIRMMTWPSAIKEGKDRPPCTMKRMRTGALRDVPSRSRRRFKGMLVAGLFRDLRFCFHICECEIWPFNHPPGFLLLDTVNYFIYSTLSASSSCHSHLLHLHIVHSHHSTMGIPRSQVRLALMRTAHIFVSFTLSHYVSQCVDIGVFFDLFSCSQSE